MKELQILYRSADIHIAIKDLFGGAKAELGRRVVLAAYVGRHAASYLPNPTGIHLICSPQPGATSPAALSQLMKAGVHVQLSKGLHSKVYWSEGRGCLITSANLSSSALGMRGLKETGVLLDEQLVDIDRLIGEAKALDADRKALKKLFDQTLDHRAATAKLGYAERDKPVSFAEWFREYRQSGRDFIDWRLGWWFGTAKASVSAKESAKQQYGLSEPDDFINVAKGTTRRGLWMLNYEMVKGVPKDPYWMFVDEVLPGADAKGKAEPGYEFQAVQFHPAQRYPTPPFEVTKPAFARALAAAAERVNLQPPGSLIPSDAVLASIAAHLPAKSKSME